MTTAPIDFSTRIRSLLELQGVALTERELSDLVERYILCAGKGPWDVREYARRTGLGAREYRVVRGSGAQNAYCSTERAMAAAVRAALDDLESGEQTPPGIG